MREGALPFSYCSLIDPEKGRQRERGGSVWKETEEEEQGGWERSTEQ